MAEFNYRDSDYRFRSPVRYFTANDPYYWEVDNIPLKQLMENDLWLRDQLSSIATAGGIDRQDFNELKPYVDGTDNKVKVKPGRFSARINDTTSSVKFMTIRRISGQMFNENHSWQVATTNTSTVRDNINKIVSDGQLDMVLLNGLFERAFTYPSVDPYTPFIDYRTGAVSWNPNLPLRDIVYFITTNDTIAGSDSEVFASNRDTRRGAGFAADNSVQSYFMKYWRGIARTSIVDVSEELEIEIPGFNERDFDYIDENGNTQTRPTAELRIDLVFIYSKPIDASEVKVLDPTTSQGFRTLNRPQLGIVKGAGAIFSRVPGNRTTTTDDGGFDENGNPQILASVADHKNVAGGFIASGVYGSFPSPDDLMNIAPLISEELEDNDPFLIGQSVLPVAYVVVRRNPTVNQSGVQILSTNSIIDIRPFFRTTELSYNERAGIAAAIPALSISNPVVTKLELRYETKRLYDDYMSRINAGGGGTGSYDFPRVVGAGYVMGGSLYGPEGAIQHKYLLEQPSLTQAQLDATLVARHGYRQDIIIPSIPDWDLARWARDYDVANSLTPRVGTQRNDWINSYHRGDIDTAFEDVEYGTYTNTDRLSRILQFGSDHFSGKVDVYFVTKTIRLNRDNLPWDLDDYFVNVNLLNCFPLSSRYNNHDDRAYPGASDIWVSRTRNAFTIYVAWIADAIDPVRAPITLPGTNRFGYPFSNSPTPNLGYPLFYRDSKNYAGFGVMDKEIFERGGAKSAATGKFPGEPSMGVSTYPTITFQVIGIPTGYAGMPTSLAGSEPTLRLF